jgi:hypothetical protein
MGQDFCLKVDEEREERQKDGVAKRCSFKTRLPTTFDHVASAGESVEFPVDIQPY